MNRPNRGNRLLLVSCATEDFTLSSLGRTPEAMKVLSCSIPHRTWWFNPMFKKWFYDVLCNMSSIMSNFRKVSWTSKGMGSIPSRPWNFHHFDGVNWDPGHHGHPFCHSSRPGDSRQDLQHHFGARKICSFLFLISSMSNLCLTRRFTLR